MVASPAPELPQEEALARLLFGRSLDKISPLQAAQLANAVAVLAGRGGVGIVGNLRRNFGLDDLDVTTAEDGTTALKAGKYISDNVYTEVEVDQDGKSQINLNLDLREGVTVKGRPQPMAIPGSASTWNGTCSAPACRSWVAGGAASSSSEPHMTMHRISGTASQGRIPVPDAGALTTGSSS